jgi:hypothetical protein
MYVGEFSAVRWAPDESAEHLKDLIDLFEARGWDWCYYAFRESDCWSVELGSDRTNKTPTATPGMRQKLIREWLFKNQKPDWR